MIKELIFKAESGQSLVDHITAESVAYLTALRYPTRASQEQVLRGVLTPLPSPPTTDGTTKRGRSEEASGPTSALTEGVNNLCWAHDPQHTLRR